jgi:FkbH-like protein
MHCRRFEYGIEERLAPGLAVDKRLTQVRPRRWAKLEGQGPQTLYTIDRARQFEQLDKTVSSSLYHLPLPYRWTNKLRSEWDSYKSRLPGRTAIMEADGFVIECMLEDGASPIHMTLTIIPQNKSCDQLYQFQFTVLQSYSCFFIPVAEIAKYVDLVSPFLVQIEAVTSLVHRDIIFGLLDFVVFRQAYRERLISASKKNLDTPRPGRAKCVVWDLDNTVWNGTLVEDGVDGIDVKATTVDVIKALDQRGILNSIASKNNAPEALAALERFGLKEYFIFPQIGWGPKSTAVRRIAEALNIGLDTVVFIDDEAFERAEISETLSLVAVFPETAVTELLHNDLFDVPATSESATRRHMYQTEIRRNQAFSDASNNKYDEFLRSCRITLGISHLGQNSIRRVYELSQRTNQLNISGTRYEENHVASLLRRPGLMNLVLQCQDRFGDYGIIGFLSANLETFEIEDFFMSCRVQRKHVEHAIFQYLVDQFRQNGASIIRVRFRRTDRNAASIALLENLGFTLHATAGSSGFLERSLDPIPEAEIVETHEVPSMLKEAPA